MEKKRMAFLYLSNYDNWPMGGMLNYVINILPGLCEHYDVDIYGCSVDGKKPKPLNINNKTYNIIAYTNVKIKHKMLPNFVYSFFNMLLMVKQLNKYDVIYSHTSATTIASRLVSRKKLIVHHQHGLSYKNNKGYIRILNCGYTIAQVLANINLIVASEKEVSIHENTMKHWTKAKFLQIDSPIGVSLYCSSNNSRVTNRFVYTGRIDPHKNIILLIDSFGLYAKTQKEAELFIIGDGPKLEIARQYVTDLGLTEKIHLVGRLNKTDIIKYLTSSEGFLFPSKGEGMSLSVLEALASGLPVAGFKVMGMKNIITNGYNGYLIEEQNPESFCQAICYLHDHANSMKSNCIDFAKRYDSRTVTAMIINYIDNELNNYINNL